jgi:hypothetical protein
MSTHTRACSTSYSKSYTSQATPADSMEGGDGEMRVGIFSVSAYPGVSLAG